MNMLGGSSSATARSSQFRNQKGLLYLSPQESFHLKRLLGHLSAFLSAERQSGYSIHLIRKSLCDLVYPLSPISKTQKLVREILEHTENFPISRKDTLDELIEALESIYRNDKLIVIFSDTKSLADLRQDEKYQKGNCINAGQKEEDSHRD